jgi:hypothetical protein
MSTYLTIAIRVTHALGMKTQCSAYLNEYLFIYGPAATQKVLVALHEDASKVRYHHAVAVQ